MRRIALLSLILLPLLACNLTRLAAQPAELPTPTALLGAPALSSPAAPTETPTPDGKGPTPTLFPTPVMSESTLRLDETRGNVTLTQFITTRRYTLQGNSAEEIGAGMAAYGPGGFWALTEPLFNWEDACSCGEGGCLPGAVSVYLTVTYTLPGWESNGDPLLAGQWNAFRAALEAHEHLHGGLAEECAWGLGAAFEALPIQASCEEIDAAMRRASEDVFPGCRAAQRALDDETAHGQTQGVVWPP